MRALEHTTYLTYLQWVLRTLQKVSGLEQAHSALSPQLLGSSRRTKVFLPVDALDWCVQRLVDTVVYVGGVKQKSCPFLSHTGEAPLLRASGTRTWWHRLTRH